MHFLTPFVVARGLRPSLGVLFPSFAKVPLDRLFLIAAPHPSYGFFHGVGRAIWSPPPPPPPPPQRTPQKLSKTTAL